MGRLEKLFCYATSPIVLTALFGAVLIVGGVFMLIGTIGYLKLQFANRKVRFS
jgi:uncharacterized membrane protein HdeD (DUF308 family)